MSEPLPITADRLPLVQAAGEWLANQSPYPKPVIANLVSEFELNILEACAALRLANELRDKAVFA